MGLKIVQVDAFAARAFRGNPAAVCVLPQARGEPWMQDVAREMNLAETAFLHPESGDYRLRWFTPAVEVALCGHAPLGSAPPPRGPGGAPPPRGGSAPRPRGGGGEGGFFPPPRRGPPPRPLPASPP